MLLTTLGGTRHLRSLCRGAWRLTVALGATAAQGKVLEGCGSVARGGQKAALTLCACDFQGVYLLLGAMGHDSTGVVLPWNLQLGLLLVSLSLSLFS